MCSGMLDYGHDGIMGCMPVSIFVSMQTYFHLPSVCPLSLSVREHTVAAKHHAWPNVSELATYGPTDLEFGFQRRRRSLSLDFQHGKAEL